MVIDRFKGQEDAGSLIKEMGILYDNVWLDNLFLNGRI